MKGAIHKAVNLIVKMQLDGKLNLEVYSSFEDAQKDLTSVNKDDCAVCAIFFWGWLLFFLFFLCSVK